MTGSTASLLARTGQRRTALVGIYGFVAADVLMLASAGLLPGSGSYGMYVFSASAIAAAVFMAVPLVSIRCPRCGLRWVGWAMLHQPRGMWFPWLRTFATCPKCGLHAAEVGQQPTGANR